MHGVPVERQSPLLAAANAMVKLHKDQFGRGPTKTRAYFAGPDILVCALSDALLPSELTLIRLGHQEQVRHARISFQAATQCEFIEAIEKIVNRRVIAFASAVDPDSNMVFENFCFEPREVSDTIVDGSDGAGNGSHGSH